jgi:glycosyltransferase involved in cell wall biosynthesis
MKRSSYSVQKAIGMDVMQTNDDLPFVSVIVPTYNEEKNIAKCLASIRNQDYPRNKLEILVVDGMSKDNTVKIAKNYDVRIIENHRRIVGNALKIGVEQAKGEIVAILNADSEVLQKDWFRRLVSPFSDPEVCGTLTGYQISKTYPPISRCYHLMGGDPLINFTHSSANTNDSVMTHENYYPTGASLLRRKVVLGAGNFKQFLPRMEDVDMTNRLLKEGYKLILVPNTYMRHLFVDSFSSYLRKTYKKDVVFREYQEFCEFKFTPVGPGNRTKLLKNLLSNITIVGSLIQVGKGIRKNRDFCWLYYPIIVLSTMATQFIVLISDVKGRKLLKEFMGSN